jgi:farnesyl-diphosphate farnesyltransferase
MKHTDGMQVQTIESLLEKNSRTFALAIPLLPAPAASAVGLAYLLMRWADVFEDATLWNSAQRVAALEQLVEILQGHEKIPTEYFVKSPPTEKPNEIELLQYSPFLLKQLASIDAPLRTRIIHHVVRTCEGMALTLSRADSKGHFVFTKKEQLKEYCYFVAGIVGELLTDVFLHEAPQLESVESILKSKSPVFGEGLQLVNILKDAKSDSQDGRRYVPENLKTSEAMTWARESLETGNSYVKLLQKHGAPNGFVAFCGISLLLAFDTLDSLENQVKMSRTHVMTTLEQLLSKLDSKIEFDAHSFRVSQF